MAKTRKANADKILKIKEIINQMPKEYVVFDIETTGFEYYAGSKIIEIGAVKYRKVNDSYVEVASFSELINPETYKIDSEGNQTNKLIIPEKIISLTGIMPDMLHDKGNYECILPSFYEFVEGAVLIAHNASFDTNFVKFYLEKLGFNLNNQVIDTLEMARDQLKELTSHKLEIVCEHLGILQKSHHRAEDDCRVTGEIFFRLKDLYIEDQFNVFSRFESNEPTSLFEFRKEKTLSHEECKEPLIIIESVAYWAKGGKERIYFNTNRGNSYYDLLAAEIGMDPWHITAFDISKEVIVDTLLEFMEMDSLHEFEKFRGKKYKKTGA